MCWGIHWYGVLFSKNTSRRVPSSMFSNPRSEASTMQSSLKMRRTINEKQAIFHIMFLG